MERPLSGAPISREARGTEMLRILLPPSVMRKWSRILPLGLTWANSYIPQSPALLGPAVVKSFMGRTSHSGGNSIMHR